MPLKAAIVPVTPFQQNCTLLWDETTKVGAVVDPGGDLHRIEAGIEKTGMRPEKILLTHGHIDHAAGAAELKEKLGGIPSRARTRPTSSCSTASPRRAWRWACWARATSRPTAGSRRATRSPPPAPPSLCCIAPAISPGSVVLVNAAQRFALVGDVLFRGSIGRTDFPYGDHAALIDTIKTKLLPLGDDLVFICGHGPMSTLGDERQTNPFLA